MRRERVIVAGLVLLAGLGVAVVGLALVPNLDESAGREQGVTLNDVVADPAAYAGDAVTVSGEYAENDHFSPDDADIAFVIGDDAGHRLLVVPRTGTTVPDLDENTVVRVRGVIRVVGSGADTGAVEGLLLQGGVLEPDDTEPILEATSVEYLLPPRASGEEAPDATTVPLLLRDPKAFEGGGVAVSGSATKLGSLGFALTEDGKSIFVSAPASQLEQLEDGARVFVRGDVSRLSAFRSRLLRGELQRAALPALAHMPREVGELFLKLRVLNPADPDRVNHEEP